MDGLLTGAFFQSYLRNSAGFCLLIHQRRAYPPAPVSIMHPVPIRATVLTGNPDEPAGAGQQPEQQWSAVRPGPAFSGMPPFKDPQGLANQ